MHVICLCSGLVGDCNNALGVTRFLAEINKEAIVHRIDFAETAQQTDEQAIESADVAVRSAAEKMDEIKASDAGSKFVVVGAGRLGLSIVATLKMKFPDIYTSWSGHQLPKLLLTSDLKAKLESDKASLPFDESILGKRDFLEATLPNRLALPGGVEAPKHVLGDRLIRTVGVPHNLTKTDIAHEAETWLSKKPEDGGIPSVEGKKKLVVFLGGDAPDRANVQKHYTPEEAKALADYVVEEFLKKGYFPYITNYPRTGRFDSQSVREEAHSGESSILEPTDLVSATFLNSLKEAGFEKGKDFYFADFRFSTREKPSVSVYKALLGINPDKAFWPGESMSGAAEGCDFFPNGRIVVYKTGSMNDDQEAGLRYLLENRTKISYLDPTTRILESSSLRLAVGSSEDEVVPKPAAMTVAEAIQADLSRTPTLGLHK